MAIYTTELLTDRDYNIPEGRLPLEYAVDQSNKAKTHSENAEVHVSAADREAWNAKIGQDGLTEESDVVVELIAGSERYFNLGNYVVIDGARVPGGVLRRLTVGLIPSGSDDSVTPVMLLEQRENADNAWQEVGRSTEQSGQEPITSISDTPMAIWEFTECELVSGYDLRLSIVDTAGEAVSSYIYATGISEDGSAVYNSNTGVEESGWVVASRFYLTQNVSKYATAGELASHTADTEVHVTADEKEVWNAAVENVSGLESTLLDQWEEEQTTTIMQLGSDTGLGSTLPIFNNCSSFIYNTNREQMFNAIRILVKADDIPTVRVNGIVGENKSFTPENDYFYMVYRFPVSISTLGDLTFTITGANAVGGGASNISNATLRFDPEKDWGYYPLVELLDIQIIHHKGVKTKVWRMYAMDAQGIASPMSLTDDGFKRVFNSLTKTWESNGWAYTTLDWGTLSLEETTPALLGFTVEIHSNYEMVENELHEIELYYNGGSTGSTLRRVRLR